VTMNTLEHISELGTDSFACEFKPNRQFRSQDESTSRVRA
jgi:hypothetical protein